MRLQQLLVAAAAIAVAAGCASAPKPGPSGAVAGEADREGALVSDPFEPVNRAVFAFNDGLDRAVLGPVSAGYRAVLPQFARDGVRNFVDNLKTPVWFANEVLQGDFQGAGVQAARFGLNTTLGVGGVYDFAARHADLVKHDEDFGQTLAVWGVGNGPYVMLPILGPSTGRDLVGMAGDYALDPLTWAQFEGDDALSVSRRVADVIDGRERTDPIFKTIRDSADPYSQARSIYIQARNRRIKEAEAFEELPPIE